MAATTAPPVICDRGDCPAPAQHVFMIHGQDFQFCGHHTDELLQTLSMHASSTSTVATERRDPPPDAVAADPGLALGQASSADLRRG